MTIIGFQIEGTLRKEKYISSRFFYDRNGSELFNQITKLDEYYPTRTEIGILNSYSVELANLLVNKSVIELGSGDARKISVLINSLDPDEHKNITYYPVDVSSSALNRTSEEMKMKFPNLVVEGIVADFIHHIEEVVVQGPKVLVFFGSTLGNFNEKESIELLKGIRSVLSEEDLFILGLDRVKDHKVLWKAYNDKKGITARFNLNILNHINTIIDSDFNPDNFSHKAVYNPDEERMEMYLVSNIEQIISSPFFLTPLGLRKGEEIHTENSYKYSDKSIGNLLKGSGFQLKSEYSDEKGWFSLLLLGF